MKSLIARSTFLALTSLLLVSCRTAPDAAGKAATRFISAADPRFRYDGRIDFSDPKAPVLIWQASRVSVDFTGGTLSLFFKNSRDQCYFDVDVDGTNTIIGFTADTMSASKSFTGLGPGRHRLVLFKRSEASAGTASFRGMEIADGAKVSAPLPPVAKLRMEFIGDSITAGACDEDGDKDQWEDRRTHNAARSYAALTARAFWADYRNISVSGMGIATGWVPMKAGETWDRLYPKPSSQRADLPAWMPDVVFVNFGENDDSFPRAHQQPFPAGYTDGYVALIQAVRRSYPAARIVLLRGGMFGGAKSAELRAAWEAAVAHLEAADPLIRHFVFTHWTSNHPRVADHRAMADELISWLEQQEFMSRYR